MTELAEIKENALTLNEKAKLMIVGDQTSYEVAGSFIHGCQDLKKQVEEFFEPTISQFKKAKGEAEKGRKQSVSTMEEILKPVNESLANVRSKCKAFENEQVRIAKEVEEKRVEEMKELERRARKEGDGDLLELAQNADVTKEPEIDKVTNLGIRRTWRWRITDINKIPMEFMAVDTILINSAVRKFKRDTNIDGIEVYEE